MQPQAKVMAKERLRASHTHKGLTIEGEDGREKDGVGMKMEGVNLVVTEEGAEELREGRDKHREGAMEEKGIDRLRLGASLRGAGPDQGLAPFVVCARRVREHGAEIPLLGNAGHIKHWRRRGGGRDLDHGL